MKLVIVNCGRAAVRILNDFTECETIDGYLERITAPGDNSSAFKPLDCWVRDPSTGDTRWILRDGVPDRKVAAHLGWLRTCPDSMRDFLSNSVLIRADGRSRCVSFAWQEEPNPA